MTADGSAAGKRGHQLIDWSAPGRFQLTTPRGNMLRLPQRADRAAWIEALEVSRADHAAWGPALPEDFATRSHFARMRGLARKGFAAKQTCRTLIFAPDGAVLGGLYINGLEFGVRQAAIIGYWTRADLKRSGVMSDALAGLKAFWFGEIGLHRMEAAVIPENTASRALLAKAGFEEEGLARSYLKIAGTWQDHIRYMTLNPEHECCDD